MSPTFYHERGGKAMSNEELAAVIRAGKRDRLMELWAQVRRFALQQARRWVYLGRGGVTLEDLEQSAFLALLDALEGWRAEAGQFLTWYGLRLKAAFTEATGQRTQRDRLDPLDRALSLEAPAGDEDDTLTLADVIPDPQAAEALEGVGVWDTLHRAVEGLPEGQREEIRRRYWMNQTTAEISVATGVPEKEVRKLEAAALRALRHPRVSKTLGLSVKP